MLQGLANMGNTCSINTMIQCLGHCKSFREMILHNNTMFKKKDGREYSIGEELGTIFKQLWIDKHSLLPARFLKALQETLGSSFKIGHEQMDFTEVWMLLMANLLEESHQDSIIFEFCKERTYTDHVFKFLHQKSIEQWNQHAKKTQSPLLDLIQGVQILQIQCKDCRYFFHNLEPFQCTYLDLPKEASELNLEKCFTELLKTDTFNDWKCDKCSQSNNEKVVRFWKLPNIWVIILNRFYGMSKLHTPISIPAQFSYPVGFEMKDMAEGAYQLKAIANHYGSLIGGHYNAICCDDEQKEWYIYDDIRIGKIDSISNVLHQNKSAYALFYEKQPLA